MFKTKILLTLAAIILVGHNSAHAAIITTPGLTGVRIWEATGPVTAYNFPHNVGPMLNQLGVGTLGPNVFDFSPLTTENYDVFYSDANGAFNPNGNYVTVEAVYPNSTGGGGLNLAAVDLLFGAGSLRADILASFQGLGPNFLPGSVFNAVDADTAIPSTATTMGSTIVPPVQHLRVTVGWSKLPVPEPSSALLMLGCGTLAAFRRR